MGVLGEPCAKATGRVEQGRGGPACLGGDEGVGIHEVVGLVFGKGRQVGLVQGVALCVERNTLKAVSIHEHEDERMGRLLHVAVDAFVLLGEEFLDLVEGALLGAVNEKLVEHLAQRVLSTHATHHGVGFFLERCRLAVGGERLVCGLGKGVVCVAAAALRRGQRVVVAPRRLERGEGGHTVVRPCRLLLGSACHVGCPSRVVRLSACFCCGISIAMP